MHDGINPGRQTTGMAITFLMTRSFIWMNIVARLTGSSSPSAALWSLPNSSLCQRTMLRPCHLFSFEAISQGVNWSMKSWGSGEVWVTVYICRSVAKCGYVSRLAGSDEKNTEATTDLISISMPALAAACLTMAWVFWRGALIEVW